ncbi:RNA-binding motif protein, X-linked 2 [Trametes pubescens]|uniref:RNA-binding motif protein, X-linked 2 n=1 Tax=Trametes pubescens TaxID=154538 RepID=A0A1M2VCY6_TRAPU|nr:RNA-binding motif protein, X-linked 2 [Trametes pubescens]
MNVVKEINKINERELDLDTKGSWHDDYKAERTRYGEIMDVNMPRDKETGKPKGFAFVMYEDQRSTVLAVDNLNGAKILERTIRVDHVKNYKQPREKGEDGELHERDEQSLNAKPTLLRDEAEVSESSDDSGPEIDPEDPMRDYLIAKRKEEKAAKKGKKSKSKRKHKDETPEERQARKERKRLRKEKTKSAGIRAAEELLNSLAGLGSVAPKRRSESPRRSRSRTPVRKQDGEARHGRHPPPRGRRVRRYRSRTPPRRSRSPMAVYHSPRSRPYDDDKRDVRREGSDRRRSRFDDDAPPRTRRGYD